MGKDLTKVQTTFLFCDGGSCRKKDSELVVREARAYIRNQKKWEDTHTIKTRCNGRCEDAPTLIVQPNNYWYKNINTEKIIKIIDAHNSSCISSVNEYLLFKENDTVLNSDNERQVKKIFFTESTDCKNEFIAVASSSDQYLYPLFKKIFEEENNVGIKFSDRKIVHKTQKHKVVYNDAFDVVISGDQINITLAIGPITKAMDNQVSDIIKKRKVGFSNVIWYKDDKDRAGVIELKNRKKEFLMRIHIPISNQKLWNYILEIYLNMNSHKPRIISNEAD